MRPPLGLQGLQSPPGVCVMSPASLLPHLLKSGGLGVEVTLARSPVRPLFSYGPKNSPICGNPTTFGVQPPVSDTKVLSSHQLQVMNLLSWMCVWVNG